MNSEAFGNIETLAPDRRVDAAAPLSRHRTRARLTAAASILSISWIVAPATGSAAIVQCVGAAADALCSSAVSPCQVTTVKDVVPGSVLDCSGIDVRISGSGLLRVTSGVFTLLADDLTVDTTRNILATPDPVVETGMEIALTGSLILNGQLTARNGGGGSYIAVSALGSMQLLNSSPAITVEASEYSTDGGEVYLSAGDFVFVAKSIHLSGSAGGDEDNLSAGGTLVIDAGGNVDINNQIKATGRWFGGGDITVYSGGNIAINNTPNNSVLQGAIIGEGEALTGYGGVVYLAAAGSVLVSGQISLAGGIGNSGGQAAGGYLAIAAGCAGIRVEDPVDLTGGFSNGGVFVAETDGPFVLTSSIDARSRRQGGDGGTVFVNAGGSVEIAETASINADGHDTASANENGEGGLVLVSGCTVDVKDAASTGAQISAKGFAGGAMSFEGSKTPVAAAASSVRVGDKALLDTTGTSTDGAITLAVAALRSGTCSNNTAASCTLNSQCVYGCTTGTCQYPNPDTDGANIQFNPVPILQSDTHLLPCKTCF